MFHTSVLRKAGYPGAVLLLGVVALIGMFLLLPSVSCCAEGYLAKASNKLGVGCVNVATCWMELPLRVYEKFDESRNPFYGVCLAPTLGVLEGNTLAAGRLAAGVADVSTFPVPWPMAHFEPVMEPVWKREPSEGGPAGAV